MDSNRDSTLQRPAEQPAGLAGLAAAVEELAAQDLSGLPDATAAARVLALWRLVERLEGQWLRELATVDARGAAGGEVRLRWPSAGDREPGGSAGAASRPRPR